MFQDMNYFLMVQEDDAVTVTVRVLQQGDGVILVVHYREHYYMAALLGEAALSTLSVPGYEYFSAILLCRAKRF